MNDLSPDAFSQAARDAGAKQVLHGGKPQSAMSWLLSRGWKLQFLLAAASLFLAYAVIAAALEWAGLRPPLDGPASCVRDLPLQERARCIREREGAMLAREKAAQANEDALSAREEAEQRKLDDEIRRQHAIERAKPLKAAFDKLLMEIATGQRPAPAANTEPAIELKNMLKKYLSATDHPLNQQLAHWRKAAASQPASKIEPPKAREAEPPIRKACVNQDNTRPALVACAEAIKLWIEHLPWSMAETRIDIFLAKANSTR